MKNLVFLIEVTNILSFFYQARVDFGELFINPDLFFDLLANGASIDQKLIIHGEPVAGNLFMDPIPELPEILLPYHIRVHTTFLYDEIDQWVFMSPETN